MLKFIKNWPGEIANLLFPGICRHCGGDLDGSDTILCPDCWQGLRQSMSHSYCPTCGKDIGKFELVDDRCHRCKDKRPMISRFGRLGRYDLTLRELILKLKYQKRSTLEGVFGQLLASVLISDPYYTDVDILIPVPMHWTRKFIRSFNQTDIVAIELKKQMKKQGRHLKINYDLVRTRRTPPLAGLSDSQRREIIKGAFSVRPDVNFANKHICIIDDITTSGITLKESARAINSAGAAKISALVLAVAGQD
ncbi:MAG: ComF family protein [Phycisphaerae bacterium]|nr:ComF family protein [Phycisphaerae bacterium]